MHWRCGWMWSQRISSALSSGRCSRLPRRRSRSRPQVITSAFTWLSHGPRLAWRRVCTATEALARHAAAWSFDLGRNAGANPFRLGCLERSSYARPSDHRGRYSPRLSRLSQRHHYAPPGQLAIHRHRHANAKGARHRSLHTREEPVESRDHLTGKPAWRDCLACSASSCIQARRKLRSRERPLNPHMASWLLIWLISQMLAPWHRSCVRCGAADRYGAGSALDRARSGPTR